MFLWLYDNPNLKRKSHERLYFLSTGTPQKTKTKNMTNIFYFGSDQTRRLSNKQRIEMWKYPVAKIYPIAFWCNELWQVMCISIKIYDCFLWVREHDNTFVQNRYNKVNICMCVGVWRSCVVCGILYIRLYDASLVLHYTISINQSMLVKFSRIDICL